MIDTSNRDQRAAELRSAIAAQALPSTVWIGCNEVLRVLAGAPGARLVEYASLPLGDTGQRLVALRHFLEHGATWLRYYAWEAPLTRVALKGPDRVRALQARVEAAHAAPADAELHDLAVAELAARLDPEDGQTDAGLQLLAALHRDPHLVASVRERLRVAALASEAPRALDLVYLATFDLRRLPATTVGEGDLRYVIVADKGEMAVRAVREAVAIGATPVVLFSEQDDTGSLQVRLAEQHGGFTIGLSGGFRESYANPQQIAARVHRAYQERFGHAAAGELAASALYPGYGPLAENTAAIRHFRREGVVFVGPAQDSVEQAGDKRKFRALAESIDPRSVTPGIVMDHTSPVAIARAIREGHASGRFAFPGRLKAANGGGGRGQVVVREPAGIDAAVQGVLSQITANGWDPGVMFEQNVPETIHLEVQVVRDRYGNARHFGMRDCSEQRASQKIQEEAPPALLRDDPALAERCCRIAVRIAEAVSYVGACTVELMFKDGHVYLLEMNTRIQVEHPVTEEAHRVRRADGLHPLNLVQLQLRVASGAPIDFAQEDVVPTHVAREFRINAEAWRPELKDPRDGQRGLFVPNAGLFEEMEVPDGPITLERLRAHGVEGIAELNVRFDVGFEVGDVLVNKDPTFGKLLVAVQAEEAHVNERYELLRLASLEVLRQLRIEGHQVLPDGTVQGDLPFRTNLDAHVRILESEVLRAHSWGPAPGRHVNWVVEMLRGQR
jgi:acetyl/propionyl-CoA carboxylase alpha subunit